jgi:pimeloyl-ACP methyl ester carboxylesterase
MKLSMYEPARTLLAERFAIPRGRPPSSHNASPSRVIALHCSGSGAKQWLHLGEALGAGYELLTPEYYGSKGIGPWTGTHAFTLADEAARIVPIIDTADRRVHLIGHSYGGAVALHIALTRPNRLASLTLYEPSAFHLLKLIDVGGAEALGEITSIAHEVGNGVITGDYRSAAASFIDYWSGEGAWRAMRPELQSALTHWVPKAPLDFTALIGEQTEPGAYDSLRLPVFIIRGAHAPAPTRLIAEVLLTLLPDACLADITGAGHMGPLTHAAEVNAVIVRHLAATDWPLRSASRGFAGLSRRGLHAKAANARPR